MSSIRKALGLTAAALAIGLAGCRDVAFYERRDLGRPLMELADSPTLVHLNQKVMYSMEGSAGGIGSGAGGGCGCY